MRAWLLVTFTICTLVATGTTDALADAPDSGTPRWPLAVRLLSYGPYVDEGWAHLESIGVHYVFLSVPTAEEKADIRAKLERHHLKPLVFRGNADLASQDFAGQIRPQLETCREFGVKYLFLSAKRGEVPKEEAYNRLRTAGDIARENGVIIVLETHPDLGTNGTTQVETMQAIRHPNVRVNFDTANITYYNHDTTAVAELRKSIGYVATVEFKDHTGAFETWDFPVLGKGVVDFPEIVRLLRQAAYEGPVTIEFEGTKGVELTREQLFQAIADSVAYARSLGVFEGD